MCLTLETYRCFDTQAAVNVGYVRHPSPGPEGDPAAGGSSAGHCWATLNMQLAQGLQEQLFTRRMPDLPTPRPAAVQVIVLGPPPEQLTSTQPPATGSPSATAVAHGSCGQPLLGSSMQCHQSEAEPSMLQDIPPASPPMDACSTKVGPPRRLPLLRAQRQYCALVWGLPLHTRRSCAPGRHCPLLPPH